VLPIAHLNTIPSRLVSTTGTAMLHHDMAYIVLPSCLLPLTVLIFAVQGCT